MSASGSALLCKIGIHRATWRFTIGRAAEVLHMTPSQIGGMSTDDFESIESLSGLQFRVRVCARCGQPLPRKHR